LYNRFDADDTLSDATPQLKLIYSVLAASTLIEEAAPITGA